MGTVPATNAATPMAQLIQNAITNCYEPWAAAENQTNLLDFNNAVAAAKKNGTAPPTSYQVWTVNVALVSALMMGTDTTPGDWMKVFTISTFTPPPPTPVPPAIPTGFPVGPQARGNTYLALDVAPLPVFPDGSPFADARGQFVKHLIAGPFGNSSWWEKVG
jgi:hypothetical protein